MISTNFRLALSLRNCLPLSMIAPLLTLSCTSPLPPQAISAGPKSAPVLAPEFIADPIEPLNRKIWSLNQAVLFGVLKPTSRVYRKVVPSIARRAIFDFSRNINYPGRVVNHLLQGRWEGAGDESARFLCNTTAGVGGLFDVATLWKMPKSNASFAQTFNHWGWQPNTFLMLPFYGPSDETHAVGLAAQKLSDPLSYFPPYNYITPVTTYNSIAHQTEELSRFISSETDSYVGTKYLWTYSSKNGEPDWTCTAPRDLPTLQTLGISFLAPQTPDFLSKGKEISVYLPSTGKKMKCNYWLQPGTAPIVFLAPGLGSHRQSSHMIFLADSFYRDGFSVVTTTGTFHPEFMENASTAKLPGYPPVDTRDLLIELTEFDKALVKKYPGRLGKKALVGASMGGFQSLYLAAREKNEDASLLRFDRYVAIDSPINLHGADVPLDHYYNAPLEWPIAQRQERLNNTLHKAAKLMMRPPSPNAPPPFDATESKFLVGLSFRLTLRDTIFSSQMRYNQGVLQKPLSKSRREEAYQEIMNCSFRDYFSKFAVPHYQNQGITQPKFIRELNLRTYQSKIRAQDKVRVIVNRNDFLLQPKDANWLESNIPSSRLTIFPEGGHLGNLAYPPVQKAILASVSDLK